LNEKINQNPNVGLILILHWKTEIESMAILLFELKGGRWK